MRRNAAEPQQERGLPREQGPPRPQGPAGEVSTQQLNEANATIALNPSGVGPLIGGFSEPPTLAELQAFAGYVESLRAALVR